jgi:hypothetical protein
VIVVRVSGVCAARVRVVSVVVTALMLLAHAKNPS